MQRRKSAQPVLPDDSEAARRAAAEGWYDSDCRRCPRLADYLDLVRRQHPSYRCLPVPPFGDSGARFLVVGLAPGKHGANATGRPFTGDHAGILLYRTLFRFAFASDPVSVHREDGLRLDDCRITNAVKCLPPANKPGTAEVRNCRRFLEREVAAVPPGGVILALGALAHGAVLHGLGLRVSRYPFRHGATYELDNERTLVVSYHCSRYNTQTGRLTPQMFDAVFETVKSLLGNAT